MPLPEPTWQRAEAPPRPPRRPAVALVLALLFGPLGLLYSSIPVGLFLAFAGFVAGLFTVGVGYLVVHLVAVLAAVPLALAMRDAAG